MDVLERDRETGTGDKGWRDRRGRFRGERKDREEQAELRRREMMREEENEKIGGKERK